MYLIDNNVFFKIIFFILFLIYFFFIPIFVSMALLINYSTNDLSLETDGIYYLFLEKYSFYLYDK
jgi:hypothetical protein